MIAAILAELIALMFLPVKSTPNDELNLAPQSLADETLVGALQTTKIDLNTRRRCSFLSQEIFELHGIEITIDQVHYIRVVD